MIRSSRTNGKQCDGTASLTRQRTGWKRRWSTSAVVIPVLDIPFAKGRKSCRRAELEPMAGVGWWPSEKQVIGNEVSTTGTVTSRRAAGSGTDLPGRDQWTRFTPRLTFGDLGPCLLRSTRLSCTPNHLQRICESLTASLLDLPPFVAHGLLKRSSSTSRYAMPHRVSPRPH